MKNRNKAVILILIFLIASLGIKWFIKSQKGTGVKVPEEESIGAIFPQKKEYSMQVLDPSVLEVPRDYQAQTAKLDEVIEGKISSQLIESEFPKIKFSAKDSIGQEHWVEATLQTEKKPNLPAVKNSVINWNGIITDIDLEYKVYDGFLKETFTLKNEKAQREFRFTLTTSDDVELTDKEGGYILGRKKSSGENLFMLKSPQGIDAKNQRIDYSYRLEKDNLILYPNRQWQLDFASFPVKIDPSISVVSWDEALVQVGENCREAACGKDGDIIAVKPAGWNWGTDERKEFVIVKIPKLNITDRDELNSRTINPPEPGDDGKVVPYPAEKRERIHQIPDLVRYGIDYTQLVSKGQLEKIRQKKDTNPVLDARNKREFIKKKVNPLSSVIPDDRRLVYQEVKQTLIKRIFSKIMTKVFAQTVVVRSIGSAGRNYSTIAAWETAQQGNLVSLNEIHRGEMYKDSVFILSATQTIDGSTTDSSRYMHLTAASSDKHNGTAGTGVVVDLNQNDIGGFALKDDFLRLEWIELKNKGDATDNGGAMVFIGDSSTNTATDVLIQNVIVHGENITTWSTSMVKGGDYGTFTLRNSIIYDGDDQGIRHNGTCATTCTAVIQNVTIYGIGGRGIFDNGRIFTVTNTISMGNGGDDMQLETAGSSCSYVMCEDNSPDCDPTSTYTACSNSLVGQSTSGQFVSTTAGSENFHLVATSTARDAGTTIASFSDDIDYQSRPQGSAWDIGADEYLVAATPTPTRTPTPTMTPTATPTPIVSSGLMAYWKMDDNVSGTGKTIVDSSGNGLNGITGGSSSVSCSAAGKFDYGCSFDGTDDYIYVNDNSTLEPSSDMTVSAWVKFNSLQASTDSKVIFKQHSTSPWVGYELFYDGSASDELIFGWVNSSGNYYQSGYYGSIPTGSWIHLVGVKSSSTIQIYVNGSITDTYSGTPVGTLYNSDGRLWFGSVNGTDETAGIIDDVRIYNRALSFDEIQTLYSGAPPPTPTTTPTVTPTQGPTATPTLTPTPTSVPIGANLDAINSIYSYSGLGYYFLDPNFDGNRTTGEDTTIFLISGSLEINQNYTLADPQDSVIFIVNGNIRISADVTFLPGVYISSQTFSIAESDLPITIEGMVYAKDVNLLRTYISETEPTYQIIYQPRYLVKLLPYLGRAQVNWQEVSP